jgi:hypothetical protein
LLGTTVLSSLAVLINPYGLSLYVEVLTFARNPNLRDLIEWTPLDFGTRQGLMFAAAFVLVVSAMIVSGRRWSAFDWLPLVAFGAATICSARMIVWWGPLAAWCLAEQTDAVMRRRRFRGGAVTVPAGRQVAPTPSGAWSVVALVAVCLAIVASPLGRRFAHIGALEPEASVSSRTPVAAVRWLRDHPPLGQVFNAYEWGDYLVWAGPQGVAVFVTSQVHLIPPDVWRDYRAISAGGPDSLDRLNSYRVQVALVDRQRQTRLARRLMADPRWSRDYVDDQAMIFARRSR